MRLSDGRVSSWLPYVTFSPRRRTSESGSDAVAAIDTDVVRADGPIASIDVRSDARLDAVAVSTPVAREPGPARSRVVLDVPMRAQYLDDAPNERGWCSPASLAMLLAYHGIDIAVRDVAVNVYDEAYGGAGNWTFAAAYASSFGLNAAVAHLRGLAHAVAFLDARLPIAVSIAWRDGELPGAPLPASPGHLVVVRGLRGDAVVVNDPAQPNVAATYHAGAFERAWLEHGGIAYLIAPRERAGELAALANR